MAALPVAEDLIPTFNLEDRKSNYPSQIKLGLKCTGVKLNLKIGLAEKKSTPVPFTLQTYVESDGRLLIGKTKQHYISRGGD